jgi:hypothetical protein
MSDHDGTPRLEWSHGRARVTARRPSDGGPPALPPSDTEASAPMHDPKTGRFVPGNRAARRRQVKARAKGISTLDPNRCASWLRPFVADGASYGVELLQRFSDPVLAKLVGDTADARTVYRALLHLAAQGDTEALKEARAWLREHRACISTLAALVKGIDDGHTADGDEAPWLVGAKGAGR